MTLLATLGTGAPAYAAAPASVAQEVHARGGYPGDIEIVSCPSGVCSVPGVGVAVSGEGRRTGEGAQRGTGSGSESESGFAGNPSEQDEGSSSANSSGSGAQSQAGDRSGEGRGARGATDGAADAEGRARERERRRAARKSAKVPETIVVFGGGSGLASMLVFVAVMALLVVFFIWLLSWWASRTGSPAATERALSPAAPALEAPFMLEDFDALANAGRWEQAVLALLLHALSAGGWRPEGTGRSRTAREVVSGMLPSDPRRALLSEIVALSEAVRFGGAAATRERFAAMRVRFEHMQGREA